MLCLTRHAGETIRIGENIVILIQRVGDTQVQIGIEAPRTLAISRGERGGEIAATDLRSLRPLKRRPTMKTRWV